MIDHATIDRVARQLCADRWGPDHWDGGRVKRNYWRRKAARMIEQERGVALADAFFGIFGMRRVK